MKNIRILATTGATVFLLAIYAPTVFALGFIVPQEARQQEQPAAAPTQSGTPASIPDSFDVNKQLTAPGQTTYVPTYAQAQSGEPSGAVKFTLKVINLMVMVIASLALIVFIIGALLTIASEGKEDRLEKGKTAMLYAIVGIIVAFMSFIIVAFVQSILF